ncbi:MAG TPA: S9 family peptidase, partial [Alphaproteobacteria bacterium]|nr:S9 family peptidase [Alphaproteobacteria bacterium]
MKFMRAAASVALSVLGLGVAVAAEGEDPYLWLEEVEGEKALGWVKAQNARSDKALKADPQYQTLLNEATNILTAKDRIPLGSLVKGWVDNFWQETPEQRGVWRRTPLAEYMKAEPKWEVLIDIDALNVAEKETWVWKGANCLAPQFERCLVTLSRGGGDASVVREFDLKTKTFVKDGFFLPEAKSASQWIDIDTLLIGTDLGQGTLTESGYPRQTRVLKRGQKLADAPVVFEGKAADVGVWPSVNIGPDGKTDP